MTVTVDEPHAAARWRVGPPLGSLLAVLVVVAVAVTWGVPGHSSHRGDGPGHAVAPALTGGLGQGTAAADLAGATRAVSGVPRGFPQTTDGAVEAYTATLGTFVMGIAALSDAQLSTLVRDVTGTALDYRPLAAQKRQVLGLGAGGLRANQSLTATCPPALGAYRASSTSATEVSVTYWGPCVYGVGAGSAPARLHVVWQWSQVVMRWTDGDWRIGSSPGRALGAAPHPGDVDQPATTFAERGRLLGRGWSVFHGAAQSWAPPTGRATT